MTPQQFADLSDEERFALPSLGPVNPSHSNYYGIAVHGEALSGGFVPACVIAENPYIHNTIIKAAAGGQEIHPEVLSAAIDGISTRSAYEFHHGHSHIHPALGQKTAMGRIEFLEQWQSQPHIKQQVEQLKAEYQEKYETAQIETTDAVTPYTATETTGETQPTQIPMNNTKTIRDFIAEKRAEIKNVQKGDITRLVLLPPSILDELETLLDEAEATEETRDLKFANGSIIRVGNGPAPTGCGENWIMPAEPSTEDFEQAISSINLWRQQVDGTTKTPYYNGVTINRDTFEVKAYVTAATLDNEDFEIYGFGSDRRTPLETYLPQTVERVAVANMNRRLAAQASADIPRVTPNWKDISSFRQGEKDRTPTTWELNVASHRLLVHRHIHQPGKWFLSGQPFFNQFELDSSEAEAAKVEAINRWRTELAEKLEAFEQLDTDFEFDYTTDPDEMTPEEIASRTIR